MQPASSSSSSSVPASAGRPIGPVLFFDGDCGLCNRIVRGLIRLDGRARLHFAPLQGPSAQAYLRSHGLPTEDFDSLIFVPDWERRDRPDYRVRTDGVIGALRVVGGVAGLLAWIVILPRSWRDAAYKGVARIRYRIFGPWTPRPLARPEWAERFLP
ncbi:thiol-disulfide oxidoreductase DCC family protein [Opitutaceae bacterium]